MAYTGGAAGYGYQLPQRQVPVSVQQAAAPEEQVQVPDIAPEEAVFNMDGVTQQYYEDINKLKSFAGSMASLGIDVTRPDPSNPMSVRANQAYMKQLSNIQVTGNRLKNMQSDYQKYAAVVSQMPHLIGYYQPETMQSQGFSNQNIYYKGQTPQTQAMNTQYARAFEGGEEAVAQQSLDQYQSELDKIIAQGGPEAETARRQKLGIAYQNVESPRTMQGVMENLKNGMIRAKNIRVIMDAGDAQAINPKTGKPFGSERESISAAEEAMKESPKISDAIYNPFTKEFYVTYKDGTVGSIKKDSWSTLNSELNEQSGEGRIDHSYVKDAMDTDEYQELFGSYDTKAFEDLKEEYTQGMDNFVNVFMDEDYRKGFFEEKDAWETLTRGDRLLMPQGLDIETSNSIVPEEMRTTTATSKDVITGFKYTDPWFGNPKLKIELTRAVDGNDVKYEATVSPTKMREVLSRIALSNSLYIDDDGNIRSARPELDESLSRGGYYKVGKQFAPSNTGSNTSGLPMVRTKAEYDALPPGSAYQGPDENGNIVRGVKPR